MNPTTDQCAQRDRVMAEILRCVREDVKILLPRLTPVPTANPDLAWMEVGIEANAFGGLVGDYRYQFEGEEDLLHLMVFRQDQTTLTVEEAQGVAEFLLPGFPSALVYLKPGNFSQHFFIGHDLLLSYYSKL